ncbi:MAG: UDP-N-acetylglucosamine--N-acetylmuramyl-(pentapeptide) pyrophosphoryl-undecaprenol N-acetylglucosamine transferase, partial [Lachnospiraceae bacterium]|nr:UDP-N-acetylglucosamine--N-acetylmuramyl-(pentapeptide) pyrophosphoryl-undecaprenol N-acetylglucosamine transferase [Lachnospiraceae bacterium]
PKDKGVLTGQPIRSELFEGDKAKCLAFTGLSGNKPILLVTGGSLGSVAVNKAVRSILPTLLKTYDIIHLCGKNNLDNSLSGITGYVQYEYIKDELKDMFAASDIIISRAGANTICELLALRKPNILIPLPASQSRGDQLLNAASFERQGFSKVLDEEKLTDELLLNAISEVYDKKDEYQKTMSSSTQTNAVASIVSLIEELL